MAQIVHYFSLLTIVLFCSAFSETIPVNVWKKSLPSDCYFIAEAGDSIICVEKTITVHSSDGTLLSESPPLNETSNITYNRQPGFLLTGDRSLLMVIIGRIVKKVSFTGELIWSKSLCDTLPDTKLTEYTENTDGNMYLYRTVENRTGLIVKTASGGTSIYRADTSLPVFSSLARMQDTLYAVAKRANGFNSSANMVVFDLGESFAKRIIDTGCSSQMAIAQGSFFQWI